MPVDRAAIRYLCTEAVFEQGRTYYDEGRIREWQRVDDVVTATVEGSKLYDVSQPYHGPDATIDWSTDPEPTPAE